MNKVRMQSKEQMKVSPKQYTIDNDDICLFNSSAGAIVSGSFLYAGVSVND